MYLPRPRAPLQPRRRGGGSHDAARHDDHRRKASPIDTDQNDRSNGQGPGGQLDPADRKILTDLGHHIDEDGIVRHTNGMELSPANIAHTLNLHKKPNPPAATGFSNKFAGGATRPGRPSITNISVDSNGRVTRTPQ
jgi:hypothetical protein